jgi:hypothetical protein
LAAERRIASGIPVGSTTRWYLEPGLPRSVGFGSVAAPPFLARTLRLSALARDQSRTASSPSLFNSLVCNFSQSQPAANPATVSSR